MNNEAPMSDPDGDDAFDVRLRACIARVEPMPPPSQRYLRRVLITVAKRTAMALVVIALGGGALWVRSAAQRDYRIKRLAPEWLLETRR